VLSNRECRSISGSGVARRPSLEQCPLDPVGLIGRLEVGHLCHMADDEFGYASISKQPHELLPRPRKGLTIDVSIEPTRGQAETTLDV